MATNLALDDKLIDKAKRLGKHHTKREAVTQALDEYVQHLQQQAILAEYGAVDYDPLYHYKRQRKRP
ncbi:MAG: type II toxin-antitoxin system VapB family antitoxin [Gammaproteobacteria bacterium]|nr:type II toxin-antitoxin system VapB family antitoxin [Gammaproteobacteria bacterium]